MTSALDACFFAVLLKTLTRETVRHDEQLGLNF